MAIESAKSGMRCNSVRLMDSVRNEVRQMPNDNTDMTKPISKPASTSLG